MQKQGQRSPIVWAVQENGCWECTSHQIDGKANRYPRICINGKRTKVHRVIYEACFGDIPEGFVVRHKCDNPQCINPEHLEAGTQADNVHDMVSRGRDADKSGEKNPKAKLTLDQVEEIKANKTETHAALGRFYGVSETQIGYIRKGKSWANVS